MSLAQGEQQLKKIFVNGLWTKGSNGLVVGTMIAIVQ
jgi:hypothetical protein